MDTECASLSDRAIAARLGGRLRALRLRHNRTQEDVAACAAVSLGTLKALEAGRGKLETLIAILRELDALAGVEGFLPEPPASPLMLAHVARGRRRASRKGRGKAGSRDDPAW
ncbi:helix-turn-helix transcriptional regulator [Acidiferrobacter sp.]|uniref:helix-turn-helix transcriptional regulator n=1 Tax=Acidiferrobacter sp. TaxID=1872107 RepID=UPI0026249284|nr:helix-turn-helix transcriptional regulator [Acidiferrobacter sp.]